VPTITKKQKTHGFLPLFLSQFLLLLATVGVGAALFVLPESKWKEAQEKFDELVEKATPVAEDAYAKAEPVATEVRHLSYITLLSVKTRSLGFENKLLVF
jgi:hypothetical protein